MNTWRPTTEAEIWDIINSAWDKMSLAQRRVWEVIKIDPVKWEENTYGVMGGGFWVVAIYGSTVIWYNDIEEGFNHSSWSRAGTIDEYWCNQTPLQDAIGESIGAWSGGQCGPPQ